MTIVKPEVIVLIVILLSLLIGVFSWKEKKLTKILSYYPFKKKRFFSLSSMVFLLGFSLVIVALLDLRGEAEAVSMETSNQDLMILIDESTSMLCEDVSPSRRDKSLFFVKYLVKNLISTKISLGVFADTYEEISPFTLDKEYLESKLDHLKTSFTGGSSQIRLSLQEAIQRILVRKKRNVFLLLVTDAEEQDVDFYLDLPENLSMGIVLVGTQEGGPIPLKDSKGQITDYKMFNNEKVITKIGSKIIPYLKEKIPNVQVWTLNQQSFPVEQVKSAIEASSKESFNQEVFYKKNYYPFISIVGLFFMGLSMLFRRGWILYFLIIPLAQAEDIPLPLAEKRKKADEFFRQEKYTQSKILYEDLLKTFPEDKKIKFNLATTLLGLKEFEKSLEIFSTLKDYEEYKRSNVLLSLKKSNCNNPENKDNKEKKPSSEKENEDNKEKNNSSEKEDKKDSSEKTQQENKSSEENKQEKKDFKSQALEEILKKLQAEDQSLQENQSKKKKGLYGRGFKKDW